MKSMVILQKKSKFKGQLNAKLKEFKAKDQDAKGARNIGIEIE